MYEIGIATLSGEYRDGKILNNSPSPHVLLPLLLAGECWAAQAEPHHRHDVTPRLRQHYFARSRWLALAEDGPVRRAGDETLKNIPTNFKDVRANFAGATAVTSQSSLEISI